MKEPIPTIKWYTGESRRLGLLERCPFATAQSCPRFYQGLSLLRYAGFTPIPPDEDDALLERWRRHPLWPIVDEQACSVDERGRAFSNFCPDLLGERFRLFATFLARCADEVDQGVTQQHLAKERAHWADPRWSWPIYKAQHYTECPLYSCLSHDWTRQISTFARILPPKVRYHVFISHASEDKDVFVRHLAAELTRLGLRVWFDEWTLKLGDSLRLKIDEGLLSSAYGVVVLSPYFFSKNWTQAELDALFAIEMSGRKVILPVLHDLTPAQLAQNSPLLAGRLATYASKGAVEVAKEIHDVVRGPSSTSCPPP